MFAKEQDIIDLIKVDKGEKTSDEIKTNIKESGAFYSAVENLNLIVKYQMYLNAAHRFFEF